MGPASEPWCFLLDFYSSFFGSSCGLILGDSSLIFFEAIPISWSYICTLSHTVIYSLPDSIRIQNEYFFNCFPLHPTFFPDPVTLPNLFLDLYVKSLFSFFSKTFQLGCSMSSSGIPNSSFRIFSTMLKAPCLFPSPQIVFHIVLILLCFAETNQCYWKIHRVQRWKGRGKAISTQVELITCMDNTFL